MPNSSKTPLMDRLVVVLVLVDVGSLRTNSCRSEHPGCSAKGSISSILCCLVPSFGTLLAFLVVWLAFASSSELAMVVMGANEGIPGSGPVVGEEEDADVVADPFVAVAFRFMTAVFSRSCVIVPERSQSL